MNVGERGRGVSEGGRKENGRITKRKDTAVFTLEGFKGGGEVGAMGYEAWK